MGYHTWFGITSGQAPLILVPKCDIGNPEVRTTFILQVIQTALHCSKLRPVNFYTFDIVHCDNFRIITRENSIYLLDLFKFRVSKVKVVPKCSS